MTAEVFLDSNILLYACSAAPGDAEKQVIAERLILESDFALSAQVLQEFVANALRKKTLGISENGIDATLELSGMVPVLLFHRFVSGMMRFMNSSKSGTVKAVSPWWGLQIMPFEMSWLRVGASEVTSR